MWRPMTLWQLTTCRSFGWMSQCWCVALLDFVVLVQVVRSWDFDRGFRDSFEKWYELCPSKTKFNIQSFLSEETFSNIDLILLFQYIYFPSIGSLFWEPNQTKWWDHVRSCSNTRGCFWSLFWKRPEATMASIWYAVQHLQLDWRMVNPDNIY